MGKADHQRGWPVWVLGLILGLPVLSGLIGRLAKGGWWFTDLDAVLCAAEHLARDANPYSLTPQCEGLIPAPFVYLPQFGELFVPLVEAVGVSGARAVMAPLVLAAAAISLWVALWRLAPDVPWRWRLAGLSLLTGSAVACGNIGYLPQAALLLAALTLKRSVWPFVLVLAAGAALKPTLLTLLLVVGLLDRPLWQRAGFALAGATLGLAGFGALVATAGEWREVWAETLSTMALEQHRGVTLFAWLAMIGIEGSSLGGLGILAVWWLAACGLALGYVEARRSSLPERVMLGLGLGLLLNPRLMDYDVIVLVPFAGFLAWQCRDFGPSALALAGRLAMGVGVALVVISLADLDLIDPTVLGLGLLSLATVVVLALGWRHAPTPPIAALWQLALGRPLPQGG
jgi:hypothetical protein